MEKVAIRGGSLAAFLYSSLAWAQQPGLCYGRDMMWGEGWGDWPFGPLMMLLFVAIIILVVILTVRRLGGIKHGGSTTSSAPAIDILKGRFARGEIDKEEFEEKRRVLQD